jgi:hypothetical protein
LEAKLPLQLVITTKMFRMKFSKSLTNASHPPVYTYRWALIIIIIIIIIIIGKAFPL